MQLIEGVVIKQLKTIPDERGFLMEILRKDDPFFQRFGQVYVTSCNPGFVKGWHYHLQQTDHFAVVKGNAKIILFDKRGGSKTKGMLNEFTMGEQNHILLRIPPGVLHGFECIGAEPCLVLNVPDEAYHYNAPDEHKLPFDTPDIPYQWKAKKGG